MDYKQFSKRFTLIVQFQGLTPFPPPAIDIFPSSMYNTVNGWKKSPLRPQLLSMPEFHKKRYSSASGAIERVRVQMSGEGQFKKRIERLLLKLIKGQR
jgi:hypothetical protein